MATSKPSEKLIKCGLTYIAATARVREIRPIVERLRQKVLNEETFLNMDDGSRVTNFKYTWLMEDNDHMRFVERMDQVYKEAGFKIQPGTCPLLIAENEERLARMAFVEASQELHDIFDVEKILYNPALVKSYVETTLNYLQPFMEKALSSKS